MSQSLNEGHDVRWGSTDVCKLRIPAAGGRVRGTFNSDLVYAPERGQPRVYLAMWIGRLLDDMTGIEANIATVKFYSGVGQTTAQFDLPVNFFSPFDQIQFPARMVRIGAEWEVNALPGVERDIRLRLTVICSPYLPYQGGEPLLQDRGW